MTVRKKIRRKRAGGGRGDRENLLYREETLACESAEWFRNASGGEERRGRERKAKPRTRGTRGNDESRCDSGEMIERRSSVRRCTHMCTV